MPQHRAQMGSGCAIQPDIGVALAEKRGESRRRHAAVRWGGSERRKQGNDWHDHEYDGQCYGNCYFFHGFGVFEFNAHLFSPFKIEMIKSSCASWVRMRCES